VLLQPVQPQFLPQPVRCHQRRHHWHAEPKRTKAAHELREQALELAPPVVLALAPSPEQNLQQRRLLEQLEERDPRDTAISMFLSNFHPKSWGFTRELASIRRVIALERRIVRPMLETLAGLDRGPRGVTIVYEELVDHPEREIRRALDAMRLPFDPAVLAPESNTRTVLTLSHEQVRRPINRSSIGRWRNYEWAFDGAWDALVAR